MNAYPIVAIIGNVNDNEKKYLKEKIFDVTLYYYKNDDNIDELIAIDKINILITIGNDPNVYQKIAKLNSFYQNRWIHYQNIVEIKINKIIEYYLYVSKNTSLISVCTTSYNSKSKILRPYHSLINQTYNDWEWVIYDDSDKNTNNFDILYDMSKTDPRIRIYRSYDNIGIIGEVKNIVSKLARGNIIVELDHDDELTTDCLEIIANIFSNNENIDFVYSDFAEKYESTNILYDEGFCMGYAGYYKQYVNEKYIMLLDHQI